MSEFGEEENNMSTISAATRLEWLNAYFYCSLRIYNSKLFRDSKGEKRARADLEKIKEKMKASGADPSHLN